jgi:hypothetical protein
MVHYTASRSARQLYQKLVAVAVATLILSVLVDTSYTPGLQTELPILDRLAKAAYSHTVTQLQI